MYFRRCNNGYRNIPFKENEKRNGVELQWEKKQIPTVATAFLLNYKVSCSKRNDKTKTNYNFNAYQEFKKSSQCGAKLELEEKTFPYSCLILFLQLVARGRNLVVQRTLLQFIEKHG